MAIILVEGIRLYGYHGCLVEEAKIGGNYVIDVEIHADLEEAEKTDKLSNTIDYVHINRIVGEEMKTRSHLIEHVCKRIQDSIIDFFPMIEKLIVKVVKVAPPINGNVENISVSLVYEKPIEG